MPWNIVLHNIVLPEYERALFCAARLGGDVTWSVDAALMAAEDNNIKAFAFMMDRVDVDGLSKADIGRLRDLCNREVDKEDYWPESRRAIKFLKIVGSRVPRAIDSDFILSRPKNVECLDYALDVAGWSQCTNLVCFEAARLGLIQVLEWALGKGLMDAMRATPDNDTLAVIAGFVGKLYVLNWLETNGFAIGRASCRDFRHSWDAFHWLRENRHLIDDVAYYRLCIGRDDGDGREEETR